MKLRAQFALVSAVLLVLSSPAATAQIPAPTSGGGHPQRVLAVGTLTFPGQWEPITSVGLLYQVSPAKERVRVENGVTIRTPPKWYLHVLASGGVAFDPPAADKSVSITAQGQIGFVRRTDLPITAWGPVLYGNFEPRAFGAALRAELMDNVGLSIGVVSIRNVDGKRVLVALDYFRKICDDLGFDRVC